MFGGGNTLSRHSLPLGILPCLPPSIHPLQNKESFNKQVPDYYCYLAYIFSHAVDVDKYTRELAGLDLKINISKYWKQVQPDVMEYVKACSLHSIADIDTQIRNAAGSIITTIVSHQNHRWPEVIPALLQLTDHPNSSVAEVRTPNNCVCVCAGVLVASF